MRNVNFLFDEKNPDELAVIQDLTSQIRGFSFKQSQIDKVKKQNHATNHCVYFLLSEGEENKEIYIGQSVNGVSRIYEHVKNKPFWQRCILFVTDNNVFSKTDIDYLEYYFINHFDKSDYFITENKDKRDKKPNINDFQEPNLLQSAKQIEFLLDCLGIKVRRPVKKESSNHLIFEASYKRVEAKLLVENGNYILLAGSQITKPSEKLKERKNKKDYDYFTNKFNRFLEAGKIEMQSDEMEVLTVDTEFKSPSSAGALVLASTVNGWDFWKGLKEIRSQVDDKYLIEK